MMMMRMMTKGTTSRHESTEEWDDEGKKGKGRGGKMGFSVTDI